MIRLFRITTDGTDQRASHHCPKETRGQHDGEHLCCLSLPANHCAILYTTRESLHAVPLIGFLTRFCVEPGIRFANYASSVLLSNILVAPPKVGKSLEIH